MPVASWGTCTFALGCFECSHGSGERIREEERKKKKKPTYKEVSKSDSYHQILFGPDSH